MTAPSHDYGHPEFHRAYVHAIWETLAAYAWQKFSDVGRGVVYLHSFYTFPDTGAVAAQTEYLIAERIAGDDLAQLVNTYDPVVEFVVLFGDAAGFGTPYTFTAGPGDLTPFEAFRRKHQP